MAKKHSKQNQVLLKKKSNRNLHHIESRDLLLLEKQQNSGRDSILFKGVLAKLAKSTPRLPRPLKPRFLPIFVKSLRKTMVVPLKTFKTHRFLESQGYLLVTKGKHKEALTNSERFRSEKTKRS